MNCVVEWVNSAPLLNSLYFSLLVSLILSSLCYLYKLAEGLCCTEDLMLLKHDVRCSDYSVLFPLRMMALCQISYTWPITIKNTLFPLMNPDKRKDKNQLTMHSLEVAIHKTFYLNIFRHLIRIQYQMGWKRNRNDRKIVKIFRRDLKNENVFSRSFQHSSTGPKKERHYAESRKRYWRKKLTFENILVIKGNN